MEFKIKTSYEKQRRSFLILPIHEPFSLSPTAKALDETSQGAISEILHQGDFKGKMGQSLLIHPGMKDTIPPIFLIGCGKEGDLKEYKLPDFFTYIFIRLNESGVSEATFLIDEFKIKERNLNWKIRQATQIFATLTYRPDTLKTQKEQPFTLRKVNWIISQKRDIKPAEKAMQQGLIIAQAIQSTKRLGDLPANICTPTYLAKVAKEFAKKHAQVSVAILEEKEMAQLGMGLILSVTAGSQSKAKFITLEYRGSQKDSKPIVLVGKGITFDTGGNSIKLAQNMIGMKYDMLGAASVLGVLQAVVSLALPINLVGVIPTCENMPGASATRPEDIVKSLSGLTVEILNTDAEGRLILADALTYCERFKPEVVIDIATLTGGCLLALGPYASGLMSNYPPLAEDLIQAGNESCDKVWQLPLWEEYFEALKTDFADIANIAMTDIGAKTIIAGCFLAKFCQKFHWAHLDVANTASINTGTKRGATGRGVALLVHYLLKRCNQ